MGGSLRGYGLVGASEDATEAEEAATAEEDVAEGSELLRRAADWLPALGDRALDATTLTSRVLPVGGLPAIGWSAATGAYVVAAHSGITLAPVLAAITAAEVVDGVELELVDGAWRPDRFGGG